MCVNVCCMGCIYLNIFCVCEGEASITLVRYISPESFLGENTKPSVSQLSETSAEVYR